MNTLTNLPFQASFLLGIGLLLWQPPREMAESQISRFTGLSTARPLLVDTLRQQVAVLAELQPSAFTGTFKFTPNYHALVWGKGKAAGEALLTTLVDDRTFYNALAGIGAIPGDNLTLDTWDRRHDRRNPAADKRIEGTPVQMLIWWAGLPVPLPLDSLLIDPGGRGFDLRFGGNLAHISKWQSGCIVCLYSCPGSKVGNHAYTVRDYVDGITRFRINDRLVPKEKTRAIVLFQLPSSK